MDLVHYPNKTLELVDNFKGNTGMTVQYIRYIHAYEENLNINIIAPHLSINVTIQHHYS